MIDIHRRVGRKFSNRPPSAFAHVGVRCIQFPPLPTSYFLLKVIEELVAKKKTKSPIWDYFGFNRAEPMSQGWCLNSQLFWGYWAKSTLIPDFFLSPFHSLISDLTIFPSAELTWSHAHSRNFSALNATVPGSSGPILANCWAGTCWTSQVQHVSQIAAVPETLGREMTFLSFLPACCRIAYKFPSVFLAPGEISS